MLQFGRWTGLSGLSQEKRFSTTIQGQAKHEENGDITFTGSSGSAQPVNSVGLGVDARFGLGPSATLDFTVVPQRSFFDFPIIYGSIGSHPLVSQSGLDVFPRQFLEEEGDLFQRSNEQNFTPYPQIFPHDMAWRASEKSTGNIVLISSEPAKLLHATKLTFRNKGKLRLGAYNALMGPVRARFYDLGTSSSEDLTLQEISNYNHLAAEYILPNNGYVHFSNSITNAGKGYVNLAPTLSYHLRDRSNQYAFSGTGHWDFRQRNGAETSLGCFSWRLARVNRRWGWSLSHNERAVRLNPLADTPPSISVPLVFIGQPPAHVRSLAAELSYRDFRSRKFIQNQFAHLGARLDETLDSPKGPEEPHYLLIGGFVILDKNFQRWRTTAVYRPYQRTIRYGTISYIDRILSPEWRLRLGYQSDLRRRIVFDAYLNADNSEGEHSLQKGGELGLSWVPVSAWSLRGGLKTSIVNNTLQLLEAPGRWVFEQRDSRSDHVEFAITFTPFTRLRAWVNLNLHWLHWFNRKAVELSPTGELKDVEWPLAAVSGPSQIQEQYEVGLQWFVSSISQVRASYFYGFDAPFQHDQGRTSSFLTAVLSFS